MQRPCSAQCNIIDNDINVCRLQRRVQAQTMFTHHPFSCAVSVPHASIQAMQQPAVKLHLTSNISAPAASARPKTMTTWRHMKLNLLADHGFRHVPQDSMRTVSMGSLPTSQPSPLGFDSNSPTIGPFKGLRTGPRPASLHPVA